MLYFKQLFMSYLDQNGVRYEDRDDHIVKVTYRGDNLQSIPVYVIFDKDGDPMVQLRCWNIANFKGKEGKGILACHGVNAEYRWVKYYLDNDGDVIAECDAYISDSTCGDVCLRLVKRIVNITDDVYPTFAKALWA